VTKKFFFAVFGAAVFTVFGSFSKIVFGKSEKMSDTGQVHQRSMQSDTETPLLWTHVVKSKRKGNNKQQHSIVSFNPTLVKRPVTDEESSQQSLTGESPPAPLAVIRPFLKGMEQDSVFIDLTPVKDRNLLNKALLQFNEDSNDSDMYEEFLGYRKQPRHYLGHAFLETMWLLNGQGRRTLIEDGIILEDGTFIKGFPSYPADATIVKLTLENLPFLPALQLKEEMAARLSAFGDVLDLGISRTDGVYQGEGYATLNLTVPSSLDYDCQELHPGDQSCPGHRHLEQLSRVIVWDPKESDQRKVLLQWDQMPDFCRNCQSSDHCRADCPDYKKWVRCYHCNETGHVVKNCGRNYDSPNKVRAVESIPSKPRKGVKGTKGGVSHGAKAIPSIPRMDSGGAPAATKAGPPGVPRKGVVDSTQHTANYPGNSAGKQGGDEDTNMPDLPQQQPTGANESEANVDTTMRDTIGEPQEDRAVFSDKPVKKLGKFEGADDVSTAKQQAAATAVTPLQNEEIDGIQPGLTGRPPTHQH